MNSYTITISSDGGHAETTVRVDDADGVPRVTEVAVKAAEGSGLSAHQLQSIDLDLLLQALTPGTRAQPDPPRPAARLRNGEARVAKTDNTTATRATSIGRRKAKVTQTTGHAEAQPVSADVSNARAYRKMPDDLAETYASTGSVTAVAVHYGVPRHTAQGWIGRLRRQG